MKSKNEEYLDGLLNSVTKKGTGLKNPIPSYENHMKNSESKTTENTVDDVDNIFSDDENEDFRAINELLTQADNNEVIDDNLAQMLDTFSADNEITAPKIKVGIDPDMVDTRDEEERKLDEAIANAEQLFAENAPKKDSDNELYDENDDFVKEIVSDISEKKDTDINLPNEEKSESEQSDSEEKDMDAFLSDQIQIEGDEDKQKDKAGILNRESELHAAPGENDNSEDSVAHISEENEESENLLNEADINLDDMFAQMDSMKEQAEPEQMYLGEALEENESEKDILPKMDENTPVEQSISDNYRQYDSDESIEKLSDENMDLDRIIETETGNADLEENENAGEIESSGNNEEKIEKVENGNNTEEKSNSDIDNHDIDNQNIDNPDINNPDSDNLDIDNLDIDNSDVDNQKSTGEEDRAETVNNADDTEDAEQIEDTEMTDSEEHAAGAGRAEDTEIIENTDNSDNENQGIETDIAELDALMSSLSEDNVDELNNGETASGINEDSDGSQNQNDNVKQEDPSVENDGTAKSDALVEGEDDFFKGLTEEGAEESPDEKSNPQQEDSEDGFEGQSLEEALAEHIDVAELEDDGDSEAEAVSKKSAKKKNKAVKNSGEKKEGFFAKIFHSLFEPLEPEDDKVFAENNELASLSAENQQVLDELESEKKAELSAGKKKKEKAKKEKKVKEKKAPKPKKEKKEKPKKEPKAPNPEDLKPLKKIPPKKIIIAFAFAITFGVLLMLPSIVLPEKTAIKEAETSYAQGDYLTAYKNLYGKTNLSKTDHSIYEKARAIARMQHFYNSYVTFTSMKKPVEALNSLMKGVSLYPEILKEAQATGDNVVENEVNKAYDNIKSALTKTYGISLDQSEKILALQDDTEYTIRLQEIAGVR